MQLDLRRRAFTFNNPGILQAMQCGNRAISPRLMLFEFLEFRRHEAWKHLMPMNRKIRPCRSRIVNSSSSRLLQS
ncbi:hypothetical protein L596_022006 [Steinernema carpocapsae]|uniref:Uncharacterized protein n=1 Tax=Steinernema carpocapsae TaxID=34508 RepID=A0A4U5MKF5_STECR|nr:hypothetical protein L596_022006 [Steinernema carpocapsae]